MTYNSSQGRQNQANLQFPDEIEMNYEAIWKLLADLAGELKKKGEYLPASVAEELRSAKNAIEVSKVDTSRSEIFLEIEKHLRNAESCLVSIAENRFGKEYAERLVDRIDETQKSDQIREQESTPKLFVRLPRDKFCVRMQTSKEDTLEKIRLLSKELGLSNEIQNDDYVLVSGEESEVRRFIKKLSHSDFKKST